MSTATTTTTTDPAPAPAPRGAARSARRAVARSAGGSRWGITLLGLVLLAAGVLTVLLGLGVFGTNRPQRPLLDPMVTEFLGANQTAARVVAIVAGVLLLVLGLVWAVRSLRPERRPDLVLDGGPGTDIRVSASAAADAVAGGASELPGVTRARARMVGSATAPAVRATVWIDDDADVADICRRLDGEVLVQVRDALGLAALPVAVRLELDASGKQSRVA
ncbi:alkaline shock response membrane anchor protein AmaP [Pseudonocardia endophytica]|uniref:Uncharacterized protein n=1 Tax=Pseudonocardia endophytica TaxID=401976 RepID=A0A4R1HU84_PSEEN|nr:alkaline shock response membrane anchor protein AmaP [Pseudonocardia endophytica]TCK24913.1 hypothetical protein EV378_0708 [Pseudonocardia endophytica]